MFKQKLRFNSLIFVARANISIGCRGSVVTSAAAEEDDDISKTEADARRTTTPHVIGHLLQFKTKILHLILHLRQSG